MSADLSEQKERAREIILRLSSLDNAKRPGGGVHGQVIGMEPYVIRATGEGLQCLSDAQSLLDELLDPFGRRAPVASAALTGEQIQQIATDVAGCQTNPHERRYWEFGSITLRQFAEAIIARITREGE